MIGRSKVAVGHLEAFRLQRNLVLQLGYFRPQALGERGQPLLFGAGPLLFRRDVFGKQPFLRHEGAEHAGVHVEAVSAI